MHVTIVDDLKENLEAYEALLSSDFSLELIQDPMSLLTFLENNSTDLVLLDLHMPLINGFELYKKFKDKYPLLPVIFLSGDPSEESLVQGLELGAADFIAKPVSLKELTARIKNKIKIARAKLGEDHSTIRIKNLTLLADVQLAEVDGKKVQLTPIEYKIIYLLAKTPNKIFSRDQITEFVWPNIHVQNQNIDTHFSNLRKKLLPFSQNIKTVKSRGYILRV